MLATAKALRRRDPGSSHGNGNPAVGPYLSNPVYCLPVVCSAFRGHTNEFPMTAIGILQHIFGQTMPCPFAAPPFPPKEFHPVILSVTTNTIQKNTIISSSGYQVSNMTNQQFLSNSPLPDNFRPPALSQHRLLPIFTSSCSPIHH
jgi:hypothetical protein